MFKFGYHNADKDGWDYTKVAAALKISVDDLYTWCRSFTPDFMIVEATNEDEVSFLLYTDGDDGMMVLYHSTEMYSKGGVKMELSSRYVELHQDTLMTMLEEFKQVEYMEYADED